MLMLERRGIGKGWCMCGKYSHHLRAVAGFLSSKDVKSKALPGPHLQSPRAKEMSSVFELCCIH